MKLQLVLIASCLLSAAPSVHAQNGSAATQINAQPLWMLAMAERHRSLIESNGPGTNTLLSKRLIVMTQRDQEVREPLVKNPDSGDKKELSDKMTAVDAQLTAELRAIVGTNGWPAIALVGYDASNAAMLVLIHSQDHDWQRSLLPMLQRLVETDKIDGSAFAMLEDKELVSEGKPQMYGTQFKFDGGAMTMYVVEDPAGLDAKRAKVMLMPLSAYKEILAAAYHMKTTDGVVAPDK